MVTIEHALIVSEFYPEKAICLYYFTVCDPVMGDNGKMVSKIVP